MEEMFSAFLALLLLKKLLFVLVSPRTKPPEINIKTIKIKKILFYSYAYNKLIIIISVMRALCSKTHFHAFSNPIFKNKKTHKNTVCNFLNRKSN